MSGWRSAAPSSSSRAAWLRNGSYDAALHAIALGFVFSMVFGHAPISFPPCCKRGLVYHQFELYR